MQLKTVCDGSSFTSTRTERCRLCLKSNNFFYKYNWTFIQVTRKLVARAEAAGFSALVLTVDAPFFGRRLAGMSLPPCISKLQSNISFSNPVGNSEFINSNKFFILDVRNKFQLPPHLCMANFVGLGRAEKGVNEVQLIVNRLFSNPYKLKLLFV